MEKYIQNELGFLCVETINLLNLLRKENKISEEEYRKHLAEKEKFLKNMDIDKKELRRNCSSSI